MPINRDSRTIRRRRARVGSRRMKTKHPMKFKHLVKFKHLKDFILLFMKTFSVHGFSQITSANRHPIKTVGVAHQLPLLFTRTIRNKNTKHLSKFKHLMKFKHLKNFILLFMNTSSIHGFSQITSNNRHPIETALWIIAVSAALWGAVEVSWSAWTRFQENPTVVSVKRNYRDWNTTFPAIVVCPTTKYDEEAITRVLKKYPHVKDQNAFAEFFKGLVSGSYLTWNETLKTPFKEVDPKEFWKIIYDISWSFTPNAFDMNKDIRSFMTDYGICYSSNSEAALYSERAYWASNNWTYLGGMIPLTYVNPRDTDKGIHVHAEIMDMSSAYTVFFLDPYEVPDVATKFITAKDNTFKELIIDPAASIVSSQSIESLSVKQRKCRFPRESNLEISPSYSYYMCRQECRMKLSKKLCGCVAYFYRPLDGYPVCDYDGIQCLIKHGDVLHFLIDEDEVKIPCDCLPLCTETTYVILAAIDRTMVDWYFGAALKCTVTKYPKLRYQREIIFGVEDLIIAIGGAAGLFLGCSLLSIAEIFYFFTFRLVIFLFRNTRSK